MFGHFNYSFNYLHLRFVQFYQVVFFIYLNFLFLMQFLKITPHLQLLQNIGYIPHAVQCIPVVYFIADSLDLLTSFALPLLSPLVTAGLFSVAVRLLLLRYFH